MSAIYLSGIIPTIVLISLCIISMFGFNKLFSYILTSNNDEIETKTRESLVMFQHKIKSRNSASWIHICYNYVGLIIVFIINITFMTALNFSYVYLYSKVTSSVLFIIEIGVAVIKTTWKWTIIPLLTKFHKEAYAKDNSKLIFQICLTVLNNIIIPLIAVAAVSPNCFYYALNTPANVDTSYSYDQCLDLYLNGSCSLFQSQVKETSYQPPFIYSYRCKIFYIIKKIIFNTN